MLSSALKCFTDCIQTDTKHRDGWFYKGYCDYDQSLQIDPKYSSAWNNKGLSLGNLGKYSESVKCFNEALLIDIKDEYALANKGRALNELSGYGEALECLNQAITIKPAHWMYFHLGNSYSGLGKKKEALESYKQCEKTNSNYRNVKDKIRELENK